MFINKIVLQFECFNVNLIKIINMCFFLISGFLYILLPRAFVLSLSHYSKTWTQRHKLFGLILAI